MATARRLLILVVVLVLPVWAAATATGKPPTCPGHPSCKDEPPPDPAGSVEITIDANVVSAQEASDTIVYRITVANWSGGPVTVEDTLTDLSEVVASGASAVFEPTYLVAPHYEGFPLGADPVTLTNTVTATQNGDIVAAASADTELHHDFEACAFGTDVPIESLGCIWSAGPGTWEVTVDPTPVASSRGVNNVRIALRDHIPGNWCAEGVNAKWRMGDDPIVATFTIPNGPDEIWPGFDPNAFPYPECPLGGAGGDFYGSGTSGSFYLVASGYVTVQQVDP